MRHALPFSLSGMDLFEEALRRWEEALTFRSRQADDDEYCAPLKAEDRDSITEQSMEVREGHQCFLVSVLEKMAEH